MGFITTRDHKTGREVYACEIGAEGCQVTGCRAHRCPFGWCQRYYICASCWNRPEIKAKWTKQEHPQSCRENTEEYARKQAEESRMLAEGAYIRRSALTQEGNTVHVLFRNAAGEYRGHYMTRETYHAHPLGTPTTPEMYAKHGTLLDAPTEFIETGARTKEVTL